MDEVHAIGERSQGLPARGECSRIAIDANQARVGDVRQKRTGVTGAAQGPVDINSMISMG
jgi:hypothetical protein